MKKIIFIINSLEIGGTEKQFLQLIKFIEKRYSISIFSFASGQLKKHFSKFNVNLKISNIPGFGILNLIFFLIRNKADIYHFFLPKSYIIGGIFTFFSNKRKIMSRRSLNNYHKKYIFLSKFIEKILHKKMDFILVNSSVIKKQLINEEDVSPSKILVTPNFQLKEYNAPIMKPFPKSKIKFGYVANFIKYKGHLRLIDICSKLNTKKKWELLLIGNSKNSLGKEVKERIKHLKLGKKIKILQGKSNIDSFYKKIDFAISVSEEEGSSNFLLESISNGLPILAFNVGGNKEFFNNNGKLIKKNDFKKFQDCLEKMIDCKNSLTLKKKSYRHSLKKFKNQDSLNKYIYSYKIKKLDVH